MLKAVFPSQKSSRQVSTRTEPTWTYLVMEHCPGLTLEAVRPEISREEVMSIAAQIGAVTRSLHQTGVDSIEGADAGESWDDLVARRRREVPPELVRSRTGHIPKLQKGLAGYPGLCHRRRPNQAPRVVVHGDLESDHILLSRVNGKWRVNSMIDFGDARVGVRDYEWMPLWLGLFDRNVDEMRDLH